MSISTTLRWLSSLGLLCLLSSNLALMGQIEAEPNYAPDRFLVYFQNGVISPQVAESEQVSFKLSELIDIDIRKALIADSLGEFISPLNVLEREGILRLRKLFPKFKPSYDYSIARDGRRIPMPDLHNFFVAEIPKSKSKQIPDLCEQLNEQKGVIFAEPSYYFDYGEAEPNDAFFSSQLSLEAGTEADIDALRAWEVTTGSYDVRVGIVDSGIDFTNEDLGGGQAGEGFKVRGGFDYFAVNGSFIDRRGHGTSVAGIVGALRNNEVGVAGIAGGDGEGNIGAALYSLKTDNGGRPDVVATFAAIMEGAVNHPRFGLGMHIMNHSYGSFTYPGSAIPFAFNLAALNGVTMVAGKGNVDTTALHYPSDLGDHLAISVGASTRQGRRKAAQNENDWGSSYGNEIDVLAPGTADQVFTTGLQRFNFVPFLGTSASTPHVTGLAALILSKRPRLHPADVEGIIQASARDVDEDRQGGSGLIGYDEFTGHGLINAGDALEMLNDPWELSYHQVTGTDRVENEGFVNLRIRQFFPGVGVPPGLYTARRLAVYKTVPLPKNFEGKFYAWGRGPGVSRGWAKDSVIHQAGFCEVVAQDKESITLRTYVYTLFGEFGAIGYHPATPVNVEFHYSLLGIPNNETPLSVSITGNTSLRAGELGEWTANTQGGNGEYEYQWFVSSAQDFNFTPIPNANNQILRKRMENADRFLSLRVQVKSGSQTETDDYFVSCIGCQTTTPICVECPEPLIQPNPVQGELHVILKGGDDEVMRTFTLFDPYGNIVRSQQSKAKEFKMDVSNQRMGIYKLVIHDPWGIIQRNILIKP